MKYPPLTLTALVPYSALNTFSEVVPAEKMAELERKLVEFKQQLDIADACIADLMKRLPKK